MEKILVVTDSHGESKKIFDIIEKERPSIVISTGDYTMDIEDFSYIFPEIKFYIVRGNCDFYDSKNSDENILKINGKQILITHGHLYGVKNGLGNLIKKSSDLKVDLVCYGHTHISFLEKINNIIYFNPGALKDGKYGIIKILKNEILIEEKRI